MTMHLIEARELNECLSDMPPPTMTCKDDSWSPDNRMVAVVTASAQLFMQSIVYAEQLREIYPDLLKRLADSNVSIQNHKMTMTGSRHLATKWGASNVSAAKETLFLLLAAPSLETLLPPQLSCSSFSAAIPSSPIDAQLNTSTVIRDFVFADSS